MPTTSTGCSSYSSCGDGQEPDESTWHSNLLITQQKRLKLVSQLKHDECSISTVQLGGRGDKEMLRQQLDKTGQEGPGTGIRARAGGTRD